MKHVPSYTVSSAILYANNNINCHKCKGQLYCVMLFCNILHK